MEDILLWLIDDYKRGVKKGYKRGFKRGFKRGEKIGQRKFLQKLSKNMLLEG